MKNIILTFLLFILSAQITFAASDKAMRDLSRAVSATRQNYFQVCDNISTNFRADFKFINYMRGKCAYMANDTFASADAIFSSIPDDGRKTRKSYNAEKSQYIISGLNKNLLDYKATITEYCKYNSAKFIKKSPQACTPARIESLFNY